MKRLIAMSALVAVASIAFAVHAKDGGVPAGEATPATAGSNEGSAPSSTLLSTMTDQCGSNLHVLSQSGSLVFIPRDGAFHRVDLNEKRFRWDCGNSKEYATCAPGTTFVMAKHSQTSREITWRCEA